MKLSKLIGIWGGLAVLAFVASAPAALIAHWPLDTDATDSSSSGYHAKVVTPAGGGFQSANAVIGGAWDNQNNASYIQVADGTPSDGRNYHPALYVTSAYSMSTWHYARSGASWDAVAGIFTDNGGNEMGYIHSQRGNPMTTSTSTTGQAQLPYVAVGAAQLNQWYNVVTTYDSTRGTVRYYVDGAFAGQYNRTGDVNHGGHGSANNEGFQIGRYKDDNEDFRIDAILDDIAVWDHSLADAEVGALHNAAMEANLNYNAGQMDQLFELFKAQAGSVGIGGLNWQNGAVTGAAGAVVDLGGGSYGIVLDGSNNGVVGVVPEPSSFALAALGLLGLLGWGRRRRR